ncbi:transposase [Sinorhizobium meliloti]|nr:transposase [Sinorhizobium meliloti]MQU68383.1 transposase [Sinorhizobium meliloti]
MSEAAKRGRRNWSLEDRWRIVEEAQLPGISVAEVARRCGVNSNLLSRWIRVAEAGQLGHRPDSLVRLPQPALDFIPIGVFGRGACHNAATPAKFSSHFDQLPRQLSAIFQLSPNSSLLLE